MNRLNANAKPEGADGYSVVLTAKTMPRCLSDYSKTDVAEGCMQIAMFLREAIASMFSSFREDGPPRGDELDCIMFGYQRCCDLLVDRLDMLTGTSPMPTIKEMEAHNG